MCSPYHPSPFLSTSPQSPHPSPHTPQGTKAARGYYAESGPPTTLSGTGKDFSLSYQHFTALDNVQFVNGNQLGTRMLFQVRTRACVCVFGFSCGCVGVWAGVGVWV